MSSVLPAVLPALLSGLAVGVALRRGQGPGRLGEVLPRERARPSSGPTPGAI